MENIDKCSLCGMCKNKCPIYLVSFSETKSPRGRVSLIRKKNNSPAIYECTLCKKCREVCPSGFDLEFTEAREELVKRGVETEANKKMIANIREHGNPFGRLKKGEKPKDLYCC